MSDTFTATRLQEELDQARAERDQLKHQLIEVRLVALETSRQNHDDRLHLVEQVATKFNFLMSLSIGGGALSAIVLLNSILGL